MKPEKNKDAERGKKNIRKKTERWIEKAEKFIDDASEKIHKSETYRKTDKSVEKATRNIFRKAGRLWGKSEQYFKNGKSDNKDDKS